MSNRIYPKQGTTYTFKQIVEQLDLRDSACLLFKENGMEQNIQDSHVNEHEVLALPHWAESRWTYRYETEEWIPVFDFASDNTISIDDLIDKEPQIDPYAEKPGVLWCVPKTKTREQYHKLVPAQGDEEAYITTDHGDRYPLPVFDEHGQSEHYYFRKNNTGTCDKCKQRVEKRFNYRDPTEGNCRLYEVCARCLQLNREADHAEFAGEGDY